MIKKYLLLTFLFCLALAPFATQAQEKQLSPDEQFIAIADETFVLGAKRQALDNYKQAVTLNPNNIKANYMTGICYLQTLNKNLALTYFLKAYELNPKYISDMNLGRDLYPDLLFLIARAYHLGENFDKAIEHYSLFRQSVETNQVSAYAKSQKKDALYMLDRKVEECNNGKELIQHPLKVSITSIPELNSEFPDYSPSINAAEDMMVFTSKREFGSNPNVDNDLYFFEDIYLSQKKEGKWSAPQLIPGINTVFHESNVGLSADGKTLLLYKDDNNGDIYVSKLGSGGQWSKPQSIGDNINTSDYKESSASISPDGKFLYFVSNRDGGMGGSDIYASRALSGGKWGAPQNLGPVINTPFDEETPVVSFDSKHLYFSSRGHKGMGGSDIFKADFDNEKGEWINPTNLGYPINTADDDGYYIQSSDSVRAYYASVRERGGQGDLDIFVIGPAVDETPIDTKPGGLIPEVVKVPDPAPLPLADDTTTVVNTEEPTTKMIKKKDTDESSDPLPKQDDFQSVTIKVIVRDEKTGEPIDADVTITEGENSEGGVTKRTGKGTYEREVTQEEGRRFKITIQKPDYNFEDIEVEVPEYTKNKQEFVKDITITPAKVNVAVRLRNVYFDFGTGRLSKKSDRELQLLENFLRDNPSIILEIAGHTDSKGRASFNLALSQRRAESIVSYLRGKGIDGSRLRPKGYGERKPLASNDDEAEGRELNRRTEFIVISKKVNRGK